MSKKMDCHIVLDLLELYFDDAVSEETKVDINNHFETCESCRKEYYCLCENLPNFNKIITTKGKFVDLIKKRRKTSTLIISSIIAFIILIWAINQPLSIEDALTKSNIYYTEILGIEEIDANSSVIYYTDGNIIGNAIIEKKLFFYYNKNILNSHMLVSPIDDKRGTYSIRHYDSFDCVSTLIWSDDVERVEYDGDELRETHYQDFRFFYGIVETDSEALNSSVYLYDEDENLLEFHISTD